MASQCFFAAFSSECAHFSDLTLKYLVDANTFFPRHGNFSTPYSSSFLQLRHLYNRNVNTRIRQEIRLAYLEVGQGIAKNILRSCRLSPPSVLSKRTTVAIKSIRLTEKATVPLLVNSRHGLRHELLFFLAGRFDIISEVIAMFGA